MNKKLIWGVIVLVIIVIVVWAAKGSKTSEKQPVRIAGGFMLTGPAALIGELQKNGASLAVEDINATGGINGRKLELAIEDFTYDPKNAISAYQKMKLDGFHNFIIDGSPLLAAMHKLITDDNNFNIAAVGYSPAYFDGDNRTCRIALTARSFGIALSELAVKRGFMKVAILAEDNEKGRSLADEFAKNFEPKGGKIVLAEYFNATAGASDFRTNITKVKNVQSQVDAILYTNALSSALPLIKQMKDLGITKQLLSDLGTLDNPVFKGDLSPMNGAEYAGYEYMSADRDSDSAEVKKFKAEYNAKYGVPPPYIAAGHYDTTTILAKAIGAVGEDPKKIADYVSSLKDYKGITGTYSFNSDCEVDRQNVFYKVVDGKAVETK